VSVAAHPRSGDNNQSGSREKSGNNGVEGILASGRDDNDGAVAGASSDDKQLQMDSRAPGLEATATTESPAAARGAIDSIIGCQTAAALVLTCTRRGQGLVMDFGSPTIN
jgi:hypothetical protein